MRIYLPEKVIIDQGRKADMNATFKGRKIPLFIMSTKIEVNDCFVI